MDNSEFDFFLSDRVQKIQQINSEYNLEKNGYIAFSGGKDSSVLSALVDMALPRNEIPRVYVNTGIDFKMVSQFVREKANEDKRFFIMNPTKSIRQLFEEIGYPFKSKFHSHILDVYSRQGKSGCVLKYAENPKSTPSSCPFILRYQFENPLPFKMSDKCCTAMKKQPFKVYEARSKRFIGLTGMRRAEKGLREQLGCLTFRNGKLKRFHPLAPCNDGFVGEFVRRFNVRLPALYYPPYNFQRTGCAGCPYNIHLQAELEMLEKLLPEERRKCEYIWKPIYEEYRRIGYRLKKECEK